MEQIILKINIILSLFWSLSIYASANALTCKEVVFSITTSKVSVRERLCFMEDNDFYISENCKKMDCNIVNRLKGNMKYMPNIGSGRPGITRCKFLKGQLLSVIFPGKEKSLHCFFPADKTTVSINMLDTWNGEKFAGPNVSMCFDEL